MSSVSSVSEVEISDYSGDSSREQSSETSEDSFVSANEDFLPYDENVEPIATEQEAAKYREQVAQEEEEEEILWSRFSGEEDVRNWFVMQSIVFVSIVDRKRIYNIPLICRNVAYSFSISFRIYVICVMHARKCHSSHSLNYPQKVCLPCPINILIISGANVPTAHWNLL